MLVKLSSGFRATRESLVTRTTCSGEEQIATIKEKELIAYSHYEYLIIISCAKSRGNYATVIQEMTCGSNSERD